MKEIEIFVHAIMAISIVYDIKYNKLLSHQLVQQSSEIPLEYFIKAKEYYGEVEYIGGMVKDYADFEYGLTKNKPDWLN